jgi:uncharacterized membrane protein YvbJ
MNTTKFQCRHCGHEVEAKRFDAEQEMGEHLQEEHQISDSLQMGFSIERSW